MPQIQSLPCLLCGLRYENGTLLEAHIRADHLRRHDPAADESPPIDGAAAQPARAARASRRTAAPPHRARAADNR